MPETQASRRILERIVATKRAEVEALRGSLGSLEARARSAAAPRDFLAALSDPSVVSVIAEIKRRSPGAGEIRADLDPVLQARSYHGGGASAVSVLTDRTYFGGTLEDLTRVRRATAAPVLRKDFVIDPLQVFEARAAGADAVLLIVRILEDQRLVELLRLAGDLGMAALVEVHDRGELGRATEAGADLIGINNRDLTTFRTDLEITLSMLDRVPPDTVVVSESGIQGPADVARLGAAGVDAVLVGEWLVRHGDARQGARDLAGQPRVPRTA